MVTIVSCYYLTDTKKYGREAYIEYIKNFMKLPFKVVIFTNEETLQHISPYLKKDNIVIEILPLTEFKTAGYDWKYQHSIDSEKDLHCPTLYMLWAEKIFFLRRAVEKNYFQSKYFFWNDIGSFRSPNYLIDFISFPIERNFVPKKMLMFNINPFTQTEINQKKVSYRSGYGNRITGLFGGDADVIQWFSETYVKTLNYFKDNNIFYGKDQELYNHIFLHHPERIKLVRTITYNGYNQWFYPHYYLSKSPDYPSEPIFHVINLESRPDRMEQIQNQMVSIKRVNAIQGDVGYVALSQTLKNLIQNAKNEKLEYLCVLEDDVVLAGDFWKRFQPIFNWLMKNKSQWHVFQGGHTFTHNYKMVNQELNLVSLVGGQTTHFVIYNSSIYDKYLEWKADTECDLFFLHPSVIRLATYPHLATQRESYSDVEKKTISYTPFFDATNTSMKKFIESVYSLTCQVEGRLGNHLFQVAHLIGEGTRLGLPVEVPNFLFSQHFKNIKTVENPSIRGFVHEKEFTYHTLNHTYHQNTFKGYFQNEKYFLHCEDKIRHLFEINLGYDFKEMFPILKNDCCAVHIRRGDYVIQQEHHPVISLSYYQKAYGLINHKIPLIIFSDDLEWCKKNLSKFFYNRVIYFEDHFVKNPTAITALALMKECNYMIGSNSSFSWWGAWLNTDKKGLKIFPERWFGPKLNHNTSDIIPSRWLRIPE